MPGPITTVCLISFSNIATDGRIRRHGDLLADLGLEVHGVGLSGPPAAHPPTWAIRTIDDRPWSTGEIAQQAVRLALARPLPRTAARSYWKSPRYRSMYELAAQVRADLYVANDWNTLPIAARLAAERGTRYAYDTHEYAVAEKADESKWRLVWPPFLRAIEGALIPGAAYVTTVSEGIAAFLQRDHALAAPPVVVRNAPRFAAMPLRPPADPLVVLFHGGLLRDRGLETLIDSAALWTHGQRLLIRGNGAPAYVEALRARAAASPAADRIAFEPAVDPTAVVEAANRTADIGIYFPSALNDQTRHALPNKFFEYTMAGLALCVLGGTELGALVTQYENGGLITTPSAAAVAAAINAMDAEKVLAYKEKSLDAAPALSWENERAALQQLYAGS